MEAGRLPMEHTEHVRLCPLDDADEAAQISEDLDGVVGRDVAVGDAVGKLRSCLMGERQQFLEKLRGASLSRCRCHLTVLLCWGCDLAVAETFGDAQDLAERGKLHVV